ncbi:MAG: dTMP kinase [Patescibacteria group bacterium]
MTIIIAIEGIDGSGKTTFAVELARHLGFSYQNFPDRSAAVTGKIIDQALKGESSLSSTELAIIFASNRRECIEKLKRNVVVDRYVLSGKVYALANGVSEEAVNELDRDVPEPNLTIFINTPVEDALKRRRNGSEIFENEEFQRKVNDLFWKNIPDNTIFVSNNDSYSDVFAKISAVVEGFKLHI